MRVPLQEVMDVLERVVFSLEAAAGYMGLVDTCPLHLLNVPLGLARGFWGTWNSHPLGREIILRDMWRHSLDCLTICETG